MSPPATSVTAGSLPLPHWSDLCDYDPGADAGNDEDRCLAPRGPRGYCLGHEDLLTDRVPMEAMAAWLNGRGSRSPS